MTGERNLDVAVIGGGLMGSAIAWGLAKVGQRVTVLDEGDVAFRASRAERESCDGAVGIEHRWSDEQLCWTPVLDAHGNTSVDGIAIAGDGAGIAGAEAAAWRGRLAAIAAARALGRSVAMSEEACAKRKLAACLRGRSFIDALYRPAQVFRQPSGETIVCRCEETTARI